MNDATYCQNIRKWLQLLTIHEPVRTRLGTFIIRHSIEQQANLSLSRGAFYVARNLNDNPQLLTARSTGNHSDGHLFSQRSCTRIVTCSPIAVSEPLAPKATLSTRHARKPMMGTPAVGTARQQKHSVNSIILSKLWQPQCSYPSYHKTPSSREGICR